MPNNELDYQVLLGTYQRKSADLLAQVIALEARVGQNNNTCLLYTSDAADE